MEKEKQVASPKETPEQRPALYCMGLSNEYGQYHVSDGVWLCKGSGKIVIKDATQDGGILGVLCPTPPGTYFPGLPTGPKYTGPIDDEMMANILIYG